jgi:hypothetical protein
MISSIISGSLIRAVAADVGRDPLERHHRARTGLLGDLGLVGGDDVHDDATLHHLGQSALDGEGAGGRWTAHDPSVLTIRPDRLDPFRRGRRRRAVSPG